MEMERQRWGLSSLSLPSGGREELKEEAQRGGEGRREKWIYKRIDSFFRRLELVSFCHCRVRSASEVGKPHTVGV